MDAALFLEEAMDKIKKLLAELKEFVRRIRHDKQLPKMLEIGPDLDVFPVIYHFNKFHMLFSSPV